MATIVLRIAKGAALTYQEVDANFSNLNTDKAELASPAFTGTPTAPTAAPDADTTQIATTAYVQGELLDMAPLASPAFTGNPTAPTPAANDNDTSIATTAYVQTELSSLLSEDNTFTGANSFFNGTGQTFRRAATQDGVLLRGRSGGTGNWTVELVPATLTGNRVITLPNTTGTLALTASPAFTGTPTAPTAAADTSTTQIATTAYVQGELGDRALTSRLISAGTGLSGGGSLAADRTLSLSAGTIASLALADTAVQPTRSISAGIGLSGGGDLSLNRTISLSAASQTSLSLADSAVQPARLVSTGTGLTGGGDLSANRTIALSASSITSLGLADTSVQPSRTITAGTGLSGGGDLSLNRTLSADFATQLEAETGTNTTKVMNPLRTAQALASRVPQTRLVSVGTGLQGGGDLSADRTISLSAATITSLGLADTAVQPARTITAGTGLTGGGNLSADRTLSIAAGGVTDSHIGDNVLTPYVSNINDGPLAGLRNLLINANHNINQRGYTSGAATSGANRYTIDRWRVVTSGQNLSWSVSNGIYTYTAPAGGVEQVIEGASNLGGEHTLSWTGTATATVDGVSVSNGGQVTLTGGANVTVRFSGGTFSRPMLEPGPVATVFERRPKAIEHVLCERYYQVLLAGARSHATGANQYFGSDVNFRVAMRASPSLIETFVVDTSNVVAFYLDGAIVLGFRYLIRSNSAGDSYRRAWIAANAEL